MARTTLTGAKAELVALFSTAGVPIITNVNAVHDHMPPRSRLIGPVDLAVYTESITADTWNIGVALMVNTSTDAKAAQDLLDVLMPRVDAATNNGAWGPAEWSVTYPVGETDGHYVAVGVYQCGREDF